MIKVLMVDDCRLITEIYSEFLTSQGYAIEAFNSPFGVTACIAHNEPDIILMDLNLPGLSGKGILKLLESKNKSRIIIISADKEESEMKILVETGLADDYFVKGQPLERLDAKIKKLLS